MAFTITHADGAMKSQASAGELVGLLAEVGSQTSSENPDIAVGHESGWSLIVFRGGRVVWENVEEDAGAVHAVDLPRVTIIGLMALAAGGDIGAVETAEHWSGNRN